MNEIIEVTIEAKTLDEARQKAKDELEERYFIISEEVISDGLEKVNICTAKITDEAFSKGIKQIPSDAKIIEKKEIQKADKRISEVKGFEQNEAEKHIKQTLFKYEMLESVQLKEKGHKGFLGLGRKPNSYIANIIQLAAIEIKFIEPAKIKIRKKKLLSKVELMNSLDELIIKTSEQWRLLDKPVQGAIAALMIMQFAFEFLEKNVSDTFNIILKEAEILFPEKDEIHQITPLHLGAPGRSYDVSDIPLISKQFKEAILTMSKLKEFLSSREEMIKLLKIIDKTGGHKND